MKKPEHTRPFNLEHARAGAPIAQADGDAVTVLAWDMKGGYPLVVRCHVSNGDDFIHRYSEAGFPAQDGICAIELVMLPLDHIDGKPVFVGDELVGTNGETFIVKPSDLRGAHDTWRWPAPAKVYPETRMTTPDLQGFCRDGTSCIMDARDIANAALRHAIDAGQVVATSDLPLNTCVKIAGIASYYEPERIEFDGKKAVLHLDPGPIVKSMAGAMQASDRAARDMAVAEAVLKDCELAAEPHFRSRVGIETKVIFNIDLAAIIAGVKS